MNRSLNLMGSLNRLGYGVVTTNVAKTLIKKGVKLNLQPIGQPEQTVLTEDLINSINNNVFSHKPNNPLIKIWHQHSLIERIGKGHYYGWPIFELDVFTDNEKANLEVPDTLLVCSKWAQEIVSKKAHRSSVVIPLGVDTEIFKPEPNNNDIYKFFTIGKLEYRKGHDFIIHCFNRAFEKTDNVELNLMVHNIFLPRELIEKWYNNFRNSKLGNKIKFHTSVETHKQIADFINKNDCGLFPARAEGWNLELLESMACNKPVIATNYSGHTEYINKDNCFLIDIKDLELAYEKMTGAWFNGQGSWAKLDYEQEEQMIEHMRFCYTNKPDNSYGVSTAQQFTWSKTAEKILETL